MANNPEVEAQKPNPPKSNTKNQHEKSPPDVPAEIHIPPAVIEEYRTGQSKQERNEWWKLRVEVATLLFIACYTIIAGYQGYKMREATEAAKNSADAAAKAAATAENTLNANNDFANKTLTEMKKQSGAMQDASDASKSQVNISEKVFEATISNSRLDQRAWVYQVGLTMDAPEVGKIFNGRVTWKNTGKTIAKQVEPFCHFTIVPEQFSTEAEMMRTVPKKNENPTSIGVLVPGGEYKTRLIGRGPITLEQNARITETSYVYIWGEISYLDIFGNRHDAKFCSYRQGNSGEFIQCAFHNDSN